MKRLENNILYVDIEDLIYLGYISPISEFEAKKLYNSKNNAIPFNNPKSIEVFMNNKKILDYNYIVNLSIEDINKELIKLEESIFYYEHQFFNLVMKDFLNKDIERKRTLRWLNHQKDTLNKILEYKQNKIAKKLK